MYALSKMFVKKTFEINSFKEYNIFECYPICVLKQNYSLKMQLLKKIRNSILTTSQKYGIQFDIHCR